MAKATIDHEEIREWVESKGGKPAAVDRTHQGGDVGILRLMFPDNPRSEHQHLVEISWDEFFRQFEESELALLYEEDSLFSKIVGRDTLERREHGEHASRHHGPGSREDQGNHAGSHEKHGSKQSESGGRGDHGGKQSASGSHEKHGSKQSEAGSREKHSGKQSEAGGRGEHGGKQTQAAEDGGAHRGSGGSAKQGGRHAAGAAEEQSDGAHGSAETKAEDDLKSREYRDKDGRVHHHTRSYAAQHGDKK